MFVDQMCDIIILTIDVTLTCQYVREIHLFNYDRWPKIEFVASGVRIAVVDDRVFN